MKPKFVRHNSVQIHPASNTCCDEESWYTCCFWRMSACHPAPLFWLFSPTPWQASTHVSLGEATDSTITLYDSQIMQTSHFKLPFSTCISMNFKIYTIQSDWHGQTEACTTVIRRIIFITFYFCLFFFYFCFRFSLVSIYFYTELFQFRYLIHSYFVKPISVMKNSLGLTFFEHFSHIHLTFWLQLTSTLTFSFLFIFPKSKQSPKVNFKLKA